MDLDQYSVAGLLTATIGGAVIGVERQWSGHATGAQARFGGIRTFTLLGGIAGVAGWLATGSLLPLAAILLAAAAAVIVVGYAAVSRHDIDGTTEVAALVVLAAGTLAGTGHLAPASGIIAATVLLLVEKTRLHALVASIDDASLRASARFAAMACIVLPLLPRGPYGPLGALRPRELWALVLFFSGLSFSGWIARRLVGPGKGIVITGLLGGIISSTSVTVQFARASRAPHAPGLALAAGAVGACTVMLVRVTLACAVLNPRLAVGLLPYVIPAFILGAIALTALWRADMQPTALPSESDTPLQLRAALQMTALFQLVLVVILIVQEYWGPQALIATSIFIGLTDLDALTLSLARGVEAGTGADIALAAGIVANTALKLTVALVVGRGSFRSVTVSVLAAMGLLIMVMLLR